MAGMAEVIDHLKYELDELKEQLCDNKTEFEDIRKIALASEFSQGTRLRTFTRKSLLGILRLQHED